MTTVRLEILKCLNDHFYDIISIPFATDEILKLIEKRIDELYKKECNNYYGEMGYGFNAACFKIKEMLNSPNLEPKQ